MTLRVVHRQYDPEIELYFIERRQAFWRKAAIPILLFSMAGGSFAGWLLGEGRISWGLVIFFVAMVPNFVSLFDTL